MNERMFPVLLNSKERRDYPDCPASIPWSLIAPHERQAQRNHSQSLERLAQRGGLSPLEILWVMSDQPWQSHFGVPVPEETLALAFEFVKQLARTPLLA